MNEFNAGVRAAKERLADEGNPSEVATFILEVQDLPLDDPFYRGYRAQMAYVLRRWCLHCSTIFDVPNRWRCCPACLPIEYADGENQSIEDLTRRVQLDDDAALEVLIDSDGRAFLVFASGPGSYTPIPTPAHERLGPLSMDVRARINRSRCGRMTRSGKPCRNRQPCRYHR
ncbi:hypothetical protein ABLE94_05335 [Gordonia sp. VNK1]|uniref:hypothetical protein n=1 Tax=Gordonia oleivorans TaxID=3156618 RepID=UPI0032B39314